MNILHAIILGIIEGVTEFLPISSTGHLILASYVLKLPETEFLKTFEIVIQLGAILAVVLLFWRRVITNFNLIKKILVAFLPTVIIGYFVYPYVKGVLLGSQTVVLWSLFIGGVIIFWYEKYFGSKQQAVGDNLETMTYKQAVGIGLAQSVSMVPGVSRAAATILGGLVAGLNRKAIVEFSFLLAIPTMAAASALDLWESGRAFSNAEFLLLAVGFITSFITAWLAVKWLLQYIESHNFISFGVYRIALAVLFWLLLF